MQLVDAALRPNRLQTERLFEVQVSHVFGGWPLEVCRVVHDWLAQVLHLLELEMDFLDFRLLKALEDLLEAGSHLGTSFLELLNAGLSFDCSLVGQV